MDTKDRQEFLSRGCKCAPQPHARQLKVFEHSCNKLDTFDWLKDIKPPDGYPVFDIAEVRFKNSRKEFFRTTPDLEIETGDIVAVESSPGHDIGIVTLTGEIVRLQLKSKNINPRTTEFRKIYRRAKISDIEKWVDAVRIEDDTMLRSRQMAWTLNLKMKISDVEYQGDRTKAVFYYTADERVDFRELIRVLADAFNVRIEMRQIGMRQEASRIGGIGSCGRELCCATWLTKFRSVSTNAARTQQLSLNPQKLAGQCSKLKCCINYENDCYLDYLKDMPDTSRELKTKRGKATFQKMDVLKKTVGYAYEESPNQIIMVPAERAKEIIALNEKGEVPDDLSSDAFETPENNNAIDREASPELGDSLTRFDKPSKSKKKRKKRKPRGQRQSGKQSEKN